MKNDGFKVSWDYDIPNIWKVIIHMFQSPPSSKKKTFRTVFPLSPEIQFSQLDHQVTSSNITMQLGARLHTVLGKENHGKTTSRPTSRSPWQITYFPLISVDILPFPYHFPAILLMICSFLMVTFPCFSDLESRIYHIYFKIPTLHLWSCIPCFFAKPTG